MKDFPVGMITVRLLIKLFLPSNSLMEINQQIQKLQPGKPILQNNFLLNFLVHG